MDLRLDHKYQSHNNLKNGDDKPAIDINREIGPAELPRKTCFAPVCVGCRKVFRSVASLVAILNFLLDLLYAYDTVFAVKTIYFAALALIAVRLLGATFICIYFYCKYVYNYRTGLGRASGI